MRWFQIDENSDIFNLANITHFQTEGSNDESEIVAYFNFSTGGGGIEVNPSHSQHRKKIGFSGNKEACTQVIKDIINGKYDVHLDEECLNHVEK